MEKRSARGRKTCLFCYAPLRVERGEVACPQCGQAQGRIAQERFWTREPVFVKWERNLRIAAVVTTVAIAIALTQVTSADSLVWGIALVAAFGLLLWYTAGCVTRRTSFMDMRFLWPPLLLCIAAGPFLMSTLLALIGGAEPASQTSASLLPALKWGVPWLIPFALSLAIPGWFARLRQSRVEGGAAGD